MSELKNIVIEREGSLGKIVLNRPEVKNALDRVMATELLHGLDTHLEDPAVRSIAILAKGDAFCAGGDLSQMKKLSSSSGNKAYDWSEAIVAANKRMLTAEKPVIAAVNGAAMAGGMGLAGMCDIVVATKKAKFAMPEVQIGLFPMIIVAHLSRSLPRKRLLEMMMTGWPMTAEEAHGLGFVNRLADSEADLINIVKDYSERFEKVSPNAVALGRRAFTLLADMPASQALDAAQFFNVPFFFGDDLREGADAFLERRQPLWKGLKT